MGLHGHTGTRIAYMATPERPAWPHSGKNGLHGHTDYWADGRYASVSGKRNTENNHENDPKNGRESRETKGGSR